MAFNSFMKVVLKVVQRMKVPPVNLKKNKYLQNIMDELPPSMISINELYVCPCGFYESDIDRCTNHFSIIHKGYCHNGVSYSNQMFRCICGKAFNRFEEIEEHCRIKKTNCMRNYQITLNTRCFICNITFEYECELKVHKKTKRHIEKDTGTYKDISLHCKICDIHCLSRSLMEKHLKTKKHLARLESPKVDLECKICNIKCLSQNQMKAHLETTKHKQLAETGEKLLDLECKICNIKCRGQKEMKKHLETKKHKKNGLINSDISPSQNAT